jgi:hypothetical protein
MVDSVKKKIIFEHNQKRDAVAKGELPGFDSVSRMPTMVIYYFVNLVDF